MVEVASTAGAARRLAGDTPVTVVMITLNEAHALEGALMSLQGWAAQVFIVDSFSCDATVDIALRYGAQIVQRQFAGFGDQWNFALANLPITTPWTMKLDPDERLTPALKRELSKLIAEDALDGIRVIRRLCFMGRPLGVRQVLLRAWRTGRCRFTEVSVNEHAVVDGNLASTKAEMEHHDSPDLEHWFDKQNRYSTSEAIAAYQQAPMADAPKLFGSSFQRRMWLKKHFTRIPLRYSFFFLYTWLLQGAWRAGRVGWMWARLRCDVQRMIDYKLNEIRLTGRLPGGHARGTGAPDPRVRQYGGQSAVDALDVVATATAGQVLEPISG